MVCKETGHVETQEVRNSTSCWHAENSTFWDERVQYDLILFGSNRSGTYSCDMPQLKTSRVLN